MISLRNEFLRADFTDQGALIHLENVRDGAGNIVAAPASGLFRMVLQWGDNWEHTVLPQEQAVTASGNDSQAWFCLDRVHTKERNFDVSVTLHARLDGDSLRFDASIENRSDAMVTDFYYPCVGMIANLGAGDPELLWPDHTGRRIPHIGQHLARLSGFDFRHQMMLTYPGGYSQGGSMSYMMLRDPEHALYFGCHDERFHVTTLRAVGDEEEEGLVGLEFDKMLFLKGGQSWQGPEAVLMLYRGDWRRGADAYRAWANTWFAKSPVSEWMRKMNGYFLVINKQQFGKECWHYDTLPELYRMAQAHGFDALGLFGWYNTGHDNGYPNLGTSPTLGGDEGLRKGIEGVHALSGHVTLYFQGNLIDIHTPFYETTGREVEGRSRWNTPYVQIFNKYHDSDYLHEYNCKVFSTACPGHPKWRALMAEKADQAAAYGADGILYDQIGGMPAYPCFHPDHHHESPSTSYVAGRKQLLGDIRDRAKGRSSEYAFLSEHITDVYAQYLDMLHGMGTYPDAPGAIEASASQPAYLSFPALFRYTFPECIVTIRNGSPRIQPRQLAYGFVYGLRYEMESRYRSDQNYLREGRTPEWMEHARKVGQLRRDYEDLLLLGRYLDQEGFACNPKLTASRFAGEKREGIALWNDTDVEQEISLCMPGYRVVQWAKVDGAGQGGLDRLLPGEIALLIVAPE